MIAHAAAHAGDHLQNVSKSTANIWLTDGMHYPIDISFNKGVLFVASPHYAIKSVDTKVTF